MSPELSIMAPDDAGPAAMLHSRCFVPGEMWSPRAFRETLSEPATLGLAGREGRTLTGMVLVQKIRPDAEILTLAVDPDLRRRGLASHLLNGLKPLLGPYGIDRLLLDVAADNEAAIHFYASHGFREDGRRKNYYLRENDKRVDAILMSRPLAGHTAKSEA